MSTPSKKNALPSAKSNPATVLTLTVIGVSIANTLTGPRAIVRTAEGTDVWTSIEVADAIADLDTISVLNQVRALPDGTTRTYPEILLRGAALRAVTAKLVAAQAQVPVEPLPQELPPEPQH